MSESLIDVDYIAKLAKLELSEEECARYSENLGMVLEHIELLKQWDIEGVPPMSHPMPDTDALRPDSPTASLSNEEALLNAPAALDGQIRVPKVVESAH